eukprot:jgi/Chrzof1/14524/Cz09g06010.t1
MDPELYPQQPALLSQTKNIHPAFSKYLLSLRYQDKQNPSATSSPADTGFHLNHGKTTVVTASHVLRKAPDQQLVAYDSEGHMSAVKIESVSSDADMDIAVLTVDKPCEPPTLRLGNVDFTNTVYILGFPANSQDTHFIKGKVSSILEGGFIATAYADDRFYGGPVFNIRMELVGMVTGGGGLVQGLTLQQVHCMGVGIVTGFAQGALATLLPGFFKLFRTLTNGDTLM